MSRQRTSRIWLIPRSELEAIVKRSRTLKAILDELGFGSGASINALKRRLKEDAIDRSHIPSGTQSNTGRKFPDRKKTLLSDILVENSTFSRAHLKARLIKDGILKNCCAICGQEPVWNGEKLVMVLDHVNGIPNDNRLENLRLLCPNCNSQTSTFSGRKHKKHYRCTDCGLEITKHSKTSKCNACSGKDQPRKVKNRPSKDELRKLISETSYCAVGREFGVSDNTIRKWLK